MVSVQQLPQVSNGAERTHARAVPFRARAWQKAYVRWLTWSDCGLVIGSVALAQALRFGRASDDTLVGFKSVDYLFVSAAIAVGWIAALAIHRTRSPRVVGNGLEEYRRIWMATLTVFGVIAVLSTLFQFDIARGYLAIAFPLGLMALTVNRWLTRNYVTGKRRQGRCLHSVLAVGLPGSAKALAESLARNPAEGYAVVGICQPGIAGAEGVVLRNGSSIPVYQYGDDIESVVAVTGADTVALTSGHLSSEEIRDLSWRLERLDVDLVVSPGMADVAGPRLTLRPAGGAALIHVDKPQYDGAKRFQKRAFDVCFASAVLIAASPVMLAAALAVKLTSRGPVFYLAERIGLDGKPFRMIKFRSMVVGADQRLADVAHLDEGGGVLFKIRRDPRVTPVGRLLRRYSLDELPQFINVLAKDMSVVGPRPPLRSEVDAYDDNVRRRLLVRPGITGLWQISGRSDLSWEDSVRLDLSYVENWSMIGDLVIAAKTVGAVWRGSGAY
jgi:exopolysaccharide biosynthesis polyprenyl glycosylphosphotransferase